MKNYLSLFTLVAFGAGLITSSNRLQAQQTGFEQPGYYPAELLAPDVPLSGDAYTVRSKGYDDGLVATFWIDTTDGQTYKAIGKSQLYQRIAEIYAIAQLRQMDTGKELGDSAGNAAKDTVTAVGKTVSDPIGFLKSVPEGASKFFGSIGEGLKGGQSQYEGKAYSNALGQSKAKRVLAVDLGVNPYSTNATLQEELNRVGWSQAGGTLGVHLAVGAIPAGAGLGLNLNRKLATQIVDEDPNQINITSRKKLMESGMSREDADLLLKHEWYSPVHRAVISEALLSLPPQCGQTTFLEVAKRASNEIDANFFQETAQLIEKYNQSQARVKSIFRSGNTVSFVDVNGRWVFPVPFDYGLWTASVHQRAEHAFAARSNGETLLLYTSGGLSDTARAACQRDNVEIMERVSLQ